MPDSPTETRVVYRSSPRTRRILLTVWALVMLLPAMLVVPGLLGGDADLIASGLVTGVIVSAVMLPIFWLSAWHYPRLILDDDDITLHQLGMSLATTWDNLAALRMHGRPGLELKAPLASGGAARLADFGDFAIGGAPMYDEEPRRLIAGQRFLPLDSMAYWLSHGDLAAQLTRRAPQLAADVEAAVAELAAPGRRPFLADAEGKPVPLRNLATAGVVIGLALGLGLFIAVGPTALASRLEGVVALVVAGAMAVVALGNAIAAWRALRRRRWLAALLWGALAVMVLLLALAAVGGVVGEGA